MNLSGDASDVVEGVVLIGVDLEALLPSVDRLPGLSEAHPGHAQSIPGARMALSEADGLLQVLARLIDAVELEKRDAGVLVGHRVGGIDLEDPREHGKGLRWPSAVGQGYAEGVQRFRFVA